MTITSPSIANRSSVSFAARTPAVFAGRTAARSVQTQANPDAANAAAAPAQPGPLQFGASRAWLLAAVPAALLTMVACGSTGQTQNTNPNAPSDEASQTVAKCNAKAGDFAHALAERGVQSPTVFHCSTSPSGGISSDGRYSSGTLDVRVNPTPGPVSEEGRATVDKCSAKADDLAKALAEAGQTGATSFNCSVSPSGGISSDSRYSSGKLTMPVVPSRFIHGAQAASEEGRETVAACTGKESDLQKAEPAASLACSVSPSGGTSSDDRYSSGTLQVPAEVPAEAPASHAGS